MKYICSHCGEISDLLTTFIDSGMTLICPYCQGKTIIDLFQPEERKKLYSSQIKLMPMPQDPKEGQWIDQLLSEISRKIYQFAVEEKNHDLFAPIIAIQILKQIQNAIDEQIGVEAATTQRKPRIIEKKLLRDLIKEWRNRKPDLHPDADNQFEAAKLNQLQSCADELEDLLK